MFYTLNLLNDAYSRFGFTRLADQFDVNPEPLNPEPLNGSVISVLLGQPCNGIQYFVHAILVCE